MIPASACSAVHILDSDARQPSHSRAAAAAMGNPPIDQHLLPPKPQSTVEAVSVGGHLYSLEGHSRYNGPRFGS